MYVARHPGLRAPSAELRYNVVGACSIRDFYQGGERTVEEIDAALRLTGRSLSEITEFLDFGCGCGRLTLALQKRSPDLHVTGCDVDERAILWCRENLPGADFVVNRETPPCPFQDSVFELIWCGSVFTHLDETHQDQWLRELRRLLEPGGILLASVHGEASWEALAPSTVIRRLQRRGLLFVRTGADAGIHPDWYQVAWHTETYIREHWSAFFEIAAYIPRGLNAHQDIVVAVNRA